MIRILGLFIQISVLLGSWGIGAVAEASQLPNPGIADLTGLQVIVCRVAGWLFAFLVIVALIFIVVAAYNYLFAGGDPGKAKTANLMIAYAAVAIAIGILARAIPFIVASLFTGSTGVTLPSTC